MGDYPRVFYGFNGKCILTVRTSNIDFGSIFEFLQGEGVLDLFNKSSVVFFSFASVLGEIGAVAYLGALTRLVTRINTHCQSNSRGKPVCPLLTPPNAYLCDFAQGTPLEADRLSLLLNTLRDNGQKDSLLYCAVNVTKVAVWSVMPGSAGEKSLTKVKLGAGAFIPAFPLGGVT